MIVANLLGEIAPPIIAEFPATQEERQSNLAERERFRKNMLWFGARAKEIRDLHSGMYICVADEKLFVGHDAAEVYSQASLAHSDSVGSFFTMYLSSHRGPKIYANRR